MNIFQAALLGLVQGLTEFLPVSSSGHLALGQKILGLESNDITFEVMVHFGTALAVLTVFQGQITELLLGFVVGKPRSRQMMRSLAIGTLPAGVIGIAFKDYLEQSFSHPFVVSVLLIFTGVVLWTTRFRSGSRKDFGTLDAVIVGFAQAAAILPGISRSGMTITAGLWRGIEGREAASFSFLLAVPVIFGATLVKLGDFVDRVNEVSEFVPLGVGAIVAYASGVFAIRWLLRIVERGRLEVFGYYCVLVGSVSIVLLMQ